jgi:hypothetical protein
MIVVLRSQPQLIEQRSADAAVYGQAVSAFKTGEGAAGLRSIDYAATAVFGAIRFDFEAKDFFAGLAIAGDAINAPAAKATFEN